MTEKVDSACYYKVFGDIIDGCEDFSLYIPFSNEDLEEIKAIMAEADKDGCNVWEVMEKHPKLQDVINSYLPDPYTSRHFQVWELHLEPQIEKE